jgi:hypothetical protein
MRFLSSRRLSVHSVRLSSAQQTVFECTARGFKVHSMRILSAQHAYFECAARVFRVRRIRLSSVKYASWKCTARGCRVRITLFITTGLSEQCAARFCLRAHHAVFAYFRMRIIRCLRAIEPVFLWCLRAQHTV